MIDITLMTILSRGHKRPVVGTFQAFSDNVPGIWREVVTSSKGRQRCRHSPNWEVDAHFARIPEIQRENNQLQEAMNKYHIRHVTITFQTVQLRQLLLGSIPQPASPASEALHRVRQPLSGELGSKHACPTPFRAHLSFRKNIFG